MLGFPRVVTCSHLRLAIVEVLAMREPTCTFSKVSWAPTIRTWTVLSTGTMWWHPYLSRSCKIPKYYDQFRPSCERHNLITGKKEMKTWSWDMAQPDGEERKGSRRSRGPAHAPLPGCCCILDMDIIWCSGQFKMKILSTSEGRLSLKRLYLEISPNIYSKDKSLCFPSYPVQHSSLWKPCPLFASCPLLPESGHLLLRTLTCLRTQCVHRAHLPTTCYLYGLREPVYTECSGNEAWQHYTKGK